MNQRGSSTLEILIAFAILIISITSVILLVFGNQSSIVDTETNREALYKAESLLEDERVLSFKDFLSVVSASSTEFSGPLLYQKDIIVSDLTQCKKQVTSLVSWATTTPRAQAIELGTFFSNISLALALGGDCLTSSPISSWSDPKRFASDSASPALSTSVDVFNKIAYVGFDKDPFLNILDATNVTLNQTSGLFVSYINGFKLSKASNDIDVVRDIPSGKNYAYLAMDDTVKQLNVVDVSDIRNPVLVASTTLKNVSASGSFPQGWRLTVYKDRLYFINRETTGAEFHIFDISNPLNPIELGNGTSINITVEDIAIQERTIGGNTVRYAFLATDQNSAEIKVYDVTDNSNIGAISEVVSARQDLSGVTDGQSVYVIGNKLYFGRLSSTGPDLYVYDISNPQTGLTLLGSLDIGTGVLDIVVTDKFAFLTTPKVNKEFQIWDISDTSNIRLIKEYAFPKIVSRGLDYDSDFIYLIGQSTPNLQILYSK